MSIPLKPWESNSLQNATHLQNSSSNGISTGQRSAPVLPPMPRNGLTTSTSPYSSYNNMSYSNGCNSLGYGGYGSNYGSNYSMPYRSSMFGGGMSNYGMMGGMGGYGSYPNYGLNDDHERRFIQYCEESSRNTFANVESIVRAVNSISMMLDNTFFAMTSSFRAVLSVADNFGKLRSMFGHIWHSINVFRLFNWFYRKLLRLTGRKNEVSSAWRVASDTCSASTSSNWSTLAFLGMLISAPYIISKVLPKFEDKSNQTNWKSQGVRAKVAFDFLARSFNELNVKVNDEVILAPTYVQEEMQLRNSGWAFAVDANGKGGLVPLNYLVISKVPPARPATEQPILVARNSSVSNSHKTHQKRVSFGENQIFENVDLEDYVSGKKELKNMVVQISDDKEVNDKIKEDNIEITKEHNIKSEC